MQKTKNELLLINLHTLNELPISQSVLYKTLLKILKQTKQYVSDSVSW